jgi:hypothetical protein
VLKIRSVPSSPHNSVVLETKAHLGPNLGLGSASMHGEEKRLIARERVEKSLMDYYRFFLHKNILFPYFIFLDNIKRIKPKRIKV